MRTKKKKRVQQGGSSVIADAINGALGKSVLRRGSDPYFAIQRIPTGSLTIDRITSGGFALGRHVELFGNESSCKSYIAYRTMALAQERGKIAAVIDPEHSFDQEWFAHLGGEPEQLLIHHPDSAEEAIKTMMLLAQKVNDQYEIEVVGIDSVATLVPLEELRNDPLEEDRYAPQARMMSRALRRITPFMHHTLFLWTNQLRTNIGAMWGDKNTTPGGRALKFYDTTRIELVKAERVKRKGQVAKRGKLVNSDVVWGNWVQCKSVKEKSARPYGEGSFIFDTDRGEIDIASEVIQLGLIDGMIERSGNTFSYVDLNDDEWSGTENQFRKYLRDNEELLEEVVTGIQETTKEIALPAVDEDG